MAGARAVPGYTRRGGDRARGNPYNEAPQIPGPEPSDTRSRGLAAKPTLRSGAVAGHWLEAAANVEGVSVDQAGILIRTGELLAEPSTNTVAGGNANEAGSD